MHDWSLKSKNKQQTAIYTVTFNCLMQVILTQMKLAWVWKRQDNNLFGQMQSNHRTEYEEYSMKTFRCPRQA